MLSPDEIDAYQRDGYLVPRLKLCEADVDKLQRFTQQLVADNPQARAAIRRPHLADAAGSQTLERQVDWLNIAKNPKVLDIVEQLIGPDIVLWTSTLFYKAVQEAATPWHRDKCPFLSLSEGEAIITVWIAVFDVLRKDGALRVLPGSHIQGPLDLRSVDDRHIYGRLCLTETDERTAVDVELDAGQMIIFDASTVHGTWPNLSSCERYGYSVRFFPATSYFDRSTTLGLERSRELILVRGEDRAGNISCPMAAADRPIIKTSC